MANSRGTIVISGDVQDVGFRGKIMRIAQKSKLVGYVENLPDGSVQIVCEGEEEIIREFKKQLDIHEDGIEVENVELKWSDATDEFKWFEVKYSDLGMEMFQGFSTAGRKLDTVGQKVDGVSSDIRAMHTDMNERFDTLDEKYGTISQQMNILTTELQKSTESLVFLTEKIGALIDQKLSE